MTPKRNARILHWHVPALVFFTTGLGIGMLLVLTATIPGIRGMGVLAMVAATLGVLVVGYTLRMEDPETWTWMGERGRTFVSDVVAAVKEVWARRRTLDRYLQGVAWAGMR